MKIAAKSLRHRGVTVVAVASAFSLMMVGCSSSGTSNDDGQVTLVLGNSQWLDQSRGEDLWASVQAYEDSADGVTLEQEAIPSSEISTKLTTELGAGVGPDVFFIQSDLFHSFADAGFLADVDGAVQDAELNDTNEGAIIDGERLGVAWQRSPYGLLYNQALLDEAGVDVPTTVTELIEAAQQIEEKTGVTGFGDQSVEAGSGDWTMNVDSWTYGAGGSWSDASGNLTIDTPENLEGFKQIQQLSEAGIMTDEDFQTQRSKFQQGHVAMMTDSPGAAQIAADAGVVELSDINAAPMPVEGVPGFHQQMYVGVNANSENLDAALNFVTWLTSTEGQESLRTASGPEVLATDVPVEEDFAAENPWAEQFLDIGAETKSVLIEGHETETSPIMQIIVEHLEQVVISGVSPQEALKAAQAEAEGLG